MQRLDVGISCECSRIISWRWLIDFCLFSSLFQLYNMCRKRAITSQNVSMPDMWNSCSTCNTFVYSYPWWCALREGYYVEEKNIASVSWFTLLHLIFVTELNSSYSYIMLMLALMRTWSGITKWRKIFQHSWNTTITLKKLKISVSDSIKQ